MSLTKTALRPVAGFLGLQIAVTLLSVNPVWANESQQQTKQEFSIPAHPLNEAINSFIETTDWQVGFVTAQTKGVQSKSVQGEYTKEQALKKLLEGTDIQYQIVGGNSITLQKRSAKGITTGMLLAQAPKENYPATVIDAEYSGPVEQEDLTVSGRELNGYSVINANTATRTDTPIFDTPVSLQVVPQGVIRDQQAFRLQDVVKNVSGVQQRFSGGGVDSFIVRGFELGETKYRNGVRIPELNPDFANVQQVEILKGPASTLYGRTEPGGLINLVTKKPSAESSYSIEQRFGSYDFYRTEANATGALTKDESLLYRVDFSYLDSKSFREHGFRDRVFVAPAVTWKPLESTEFNLTVEYHNEDRVYDSGIPAIGNKIASIPITRQFDTPGLNDEHESILVDFNWSHQFNEDWKIQNGMTAMYYDQEWNETYTSGLENDNRSLRRNAWFGERERDLYAVYLNLTGKFETFGVKHSVLLGGDFYNDHATSFATDNFIGSTVDILKPVFPSNLNLAQYDNLPLSFFRDQQGGYFEDRKDTWYGVYFQDQLSFFDDTLHIMGGGRYDWATIESENAYFTPLSSSKNSDSQFSPRVGITYQPWNWLSVYGNYIESFGANNGSSTTGQTFDPQTAEQFEAGFKTEFFDGRFSSTLAYYHLTKNNVLTPAPNNSNFRVPIGEARSQGIELDVSGQLTDGLSMIASYAYTDAKITKDNSGNQGNRLPYVPEHSGSLWLKYDFQQASLQGFSTGIGVFAAGKRFGDAANSYQDGSYARLDLFGAYRQKIGETHLTAQLNVNNVTGTEYFVLRDRRRNLPAEPLTVMGSLRLEF